MVQAKKAEKKKNRVLANKGYGVKGERKPRKNPTHVRSLENRGTKKMRREE